MQVQDVTWVTTVECHRRELWNPDGDILDLDKGEWVLKALQAAHLKGVNLLTFNTWIPFWVVFSFFFYELWCFISKLVLINVEIHLRHLCILNPSLACRPWNPFLEAWHLTNIFCLPGSTHIHCLKLKFHETCFMFKDVSPIFLCLTFAQILDL